MNTDNPLGNREKGILHRFFLHLDGYEVPNHGRQSVLANGTMVIENAHKLHDEGFYTCTAFNQHDESHSGTVQIEVLSK